MIAQTAAFLAGIAVNVACSLVSIRLWRRMTPQEATQYAIALGIISLAAYIAAALYLWRP